MPSAWVLGPLVLKSSLVILIVSFFVAFVLFWFISPFSKQVTKERMDNIGSFLFTFVVTLIIGKILTNLSIFLSDPRVILAYPSDSRAFYVAVVLTIIFAKFKLFKRKSLFDFLYPWMQVFLTASFVYEFIYMIWGGRSYSIGYLGLLVILLVTLYSLQGKMKMDVLALLMLIGWAVGQLLLSILSITSVFQFYLSPWFYCIVSIISLVFFLYQRRVNQ